MQQTRLIQNIVGGSYEADERIAGCAVSQNLYAESVEEASNGFYYTTALRSVDGERVVLDFENVVPDQYAQGCRGLFCASDDTIFAAFGSSVVRIARNGITGEYSSETIYTEPNPTSGKVRFAETGGINSHVVWADGSEWIKAYPLVPEKAQGITIPIRFRTPLRVYLTADEILQEQNFHVKPSHVCSVNGSIVINDPETDTFYFTEPYVLGGTDYTRKVYDLQNGNIQYEAGTYNVKTKPVYVWDTDPSSGTSYLWLDRYSKAKFRTAEYSADRIVSMVVNGDQLFVIGSKSMQVLSQSMSTDAQGFSNMIFDDSGRSTADLGTRAADSVALVDGMVVFLGASARGERSVRCTSGGEVMRISTNAIERELEGKNVDSAYGFGWVQNGHTFYVLSVPSVNKSYVYDFATRQWHNRTTRNPNGSDSLWWVRYAVNCSGDILLASGKTLKLAKFDRTKYDDYRDEPIIKRRTAPCLTSDYSPFMVNNLLLMWNTGSTDDRNNEKYSKNPVVMLEVSTDGGNTFGTELWANGGETGHYGHRTVWYGIGCGQMFVFRFTISDRVNVVITGAKVSFTKLRAF